MTTSTYQLRAFGLVLVLTAFSSGLEIFTPFHNLPPRSLLDYYQLIKNPQSLKGIQKRVRGIHGRNPPTWITDFQSWDAFEHEISFIWRNAKEYNEDGSEIFELASELEVRLYCSRVIERIMADNATTDILQATACPREITG